MQIKKSYKRILAGLAALAIVFSNMQAMPDNAFNINWAITASAAEEETVCGDFTVTGGTLGTDFEFEDYTLYRQGYQLRIKSDAELTIRNTDPNTATDNSIFINNDVNANITLAGVNIVTTSKHAPFAIGLNSRGNVNITLADGTTNILQSNVGYYSGLQKQCDFSNTGTLTIDGSGTLYATGGNHATGIGCNQSTNVNETYEGTANIIINGGTIIAKGGEKAAGIGTDYWHKASNITINGGNVTAIGGEDASGIGNGDHSDTDASITINGGTVTATGSNNGVGINGAPFVCTGNPVVYANSISDYSNSDNWNGIIFDGDNNGTVYGNVTLSQDLNISSGQKLIVPEGASLSIAEGTTITNEGTIENSGTIISVGGIISGSGTIDGGGETSLETISADMITVPNIYYFEDGQDMSEYIASKAKVYFLGKEYDAVSNGWEKTVTKNSDTSYTLTYTNGDKSVSKGVTAEKANCTFELTPEKDIYEFYEYFTINAEVSGEGAELIQYAKIIYGDNYRGLHFGTTSENVSAGSFINNAHAFDIPSKGGEITFDVVFYAGDSSGYPEAGRQTVTVNFNACQHNNNVDPAICNTLSWCRDCGDYFGEYAPHKSDENGICTYCRQIIIDEKNFPDATFRSYVSENFDTDNSGTLSEEEIGNVTEIDVNGLSISSLKGIEFFTSLEVLYCNDNHLTSLDVSSNTNLTYLHCYRNQLTSLNVSGNTNLTYLDCYNNQLTSLDVSGNTNLTALSCSGNALTNLNLSSNTNLTSLYCSDNPLTSLNVSSNTNLTSLHCSNNQLTSLDVSSNINLTELECANNQLAVFDVNSNTNLTFLYCSYNPLTSLDVSSNTALTYLGCQQNNLTSLDVSSNTALTYLDCSDNQLTSLDLSSNINLTELECGANPSLASIAFANDTPPATFDHDCKLENEKCKFCNQIMIVEENFPDVNFRSYVSENFDADNSGTLSEEEISNVTVINVNGLSISSLKGIEFFTSLEALRCYDNQLTSLDVSSNTNLTYLNCASNALTSLNVRSNTNLTYLDCASNALTSLNVRSNTNLTTLYCSDNKLTSLDVSSNTNLTFLSCPDNQLTSLDLSSNTALTFLSCPDNQLTSLDLSSNTALTFLSCQDNQLTSLDLSSNTALTSLGCSGNAFTSLDLSSCTALTSLDCGANPSLASIKFANDTPPAIFVHDCYLVDGKCTICRNVPISAENFPDENFRSYVSENFDTDKSGSLSEEEIGKVTEIDVNHKEISDLKGIEFFTALTSLNSTANSLTSLELGKNTNLTKLVCVSNSLTSLELGSNTKLTYLDCRYNELTSLNVSKNTNLTKLVCASNSLTSLDLGSNTNLTKLVCSNTLLTSLELGSITNLTELNCQTSGLTSLDVSKNTKLVVLKCQYNALTSLELGDNTNLTELYCYGNNLKSLDVSLNTSIERIHCLKNELTSLELGDNTKLTYLDCQQNNLTKLELSGCTALTNLYCNENPSLESIKFANDTPPATFYHDCYFVGGKCTICGNVMIDEESFPDENFRSYVSENFDTDKSGILSEEEISNVTSIDVNGKGITNLNGIEFFTALKQLYCMRNDLTSLNLSRNTNLEELYCYENKLEKLNLNNLTNLTNLHCNNNKLTELDLSGNTNLTAMYCNNNQLESLDLRNCTKLNTLICMENKSLSSIKFANDTPPATFGHSCYLVDSKCTICGNVMIDEESFPDTSFRTYVLLSLTNRKNVLTQEQINNITELDLSLLNISDLKGIEYFTALTSLNCADNNLTGLDLSGNTALTALDCTGNPSLASIKFANDALPETFAHDCHYEEGFCTICNHEHGENEHTIISIEGKAPTCTEDGITAGDKCSVCGKNFTGQTVLPATGHADADNDGICDNECGLEMMATLKEVSATLDGDIGMNYYIALPESVAKNAGSYVMFTVNGKTPKLLSIPAPEADGTYKFTYRMNAKEMHDKVTFAVYDGSGNPVELYSKSGKQIEGSAFEYSLAEYFDKLSSISSIDEKLANLAKATLDYGSYAQHAFKYNVGAANCDTDLSGITAETLASHKMTKTGDIPKGLKFSGMTLILETETTLCLYFRADDISKYSFTLDGAAVSAEQTKEGFYCIKVADIAAKDLDTLHKLVINSSCTITFDAFSYAYSVVNAGQNEAVCNAVRALYMYNEAANKYFGE